MSYTITAGKSTVRGATVGEAVIQAIGATERAVADLRARQTELDAQLAKQRNWLQDNRHDPLWEQRKAIHDDRLAERADVVQRGDKLLEVLWASVESLDGDERETALRRILQWEEPPF